MRTSYTKNIFFFLAFILFFSPRSLLAKSLYVNGNDTIHLANLSPIATIDTLIAISSILHQEEKYEASLFALQDATFHAEKEKHAEKLSEIYLNIARNYHRINNYSSALDYLKKGLKIEEKRKSNKYDSLISLIATCYANTGDYEAAYKYRLKSIEIKEAKSDTEGLASDYYDLGTLFYYQSAFEKALEYYQKSHEIAKKINSIRLIYNGTAAIGATYSSLGNLEVSLKYNLRSLEIADSVDYKTGQAYALNNIASNYYDAGDLVNSTMYCRKSLDIKKVTNDKWGQIGSYFTISKIYTKEKKYDQAEAELKQALAISKEINSKVRVAEVYDRLAKLYQVAGKKDQAIEYLNKYIVFKDSIMNERIIDKMSDQKSEFEVQKREHEINLLKKDNELLEVQKRAQKFNMYLTSGFAIFFLILASILLSLFYRKRKLAELLRAKNIKISLQNEQIEKQNQDLANSNNDLQEFTSIASHDLREPLRMIKSYGTIINRRYKDKLDANGQEFLFFMTDAASRMDRMLLDLLKYARTSNSEDKKSVDLQEIVLNVKQMILMGDRHPNASIVLISDKFPTVYGRETNLFQLFQNLITNGLKYSTAQHPRVEINYKLKDDKHVFSFKDNGIGIAPEDQQRIFVMFQRLHTRNEYEGTGIGLATCKKIIDRHGGEIWLESKPNEGSTFFFSLPN